MSNTFNVSYNAGGTVDKVKNIVGVENIDNLDEVQVVNEVKMIGKIQGFAAMTQPYNVMEMLSIPAGVEVVEKEILLPDQEVEVLAITVTCSGYGEDDKYNLWFNDQLWFKDWYCSEVKDGLFLGTSTYVYSAPAKSKIRIAFKNASMTSKRVWVGVRMLVATSPKDI